LIKEGEVKSSIPAECTLKPNTMPKVNNVITRILTCIQDKYSGMGVAPFYLDNAYSHASDLNNDIGRALSLIQSFGNAVFISEAQGAGDRLVAETSACLGSDEFIQQAVQLDIGSLFDLCRDQAGASFQNIIHSLRDAEGKIGLVITALEKVAEDENIVSLLCEAVESKSMPILAAIDMEGFRKLEVRPVLSGSLQFILAEKERPQAKRNKSVLIIGATSFFGNAVYKLFGQEYEDVRGTGFSKASSLDFDKLDVTSEEEIKKYFSEHPDFDIIVYIAGEADAELAEKERDRARVLNTDAVSTIARHAKNCKFVYISSEYVFDGGVGPYGSGSLANPINYYGRTKLEGEKVSLKDFSNVLVVRLGALYGYNGPDDKKTTVSKLIAGLDNAEPLKADNIQIKHPVLIEDAARTLLKLLDYGVAGIYQVNGPEGLNKQEMAKRIAAVRNEVTGRTFSYPIVGVEQTSAAGKPLNTHMVNVDTPRPFNEGIRFLLKKQETLKEKKNHD